MQKLAPALIIETVNYANPPPILYNNSSFVFAVKDDITGMKVDDPSYFTIDVSASQIIVNENGTIDRQKERKTWHSCNINDTSDPSDLKILSNSYCLDNSTFLLDGYLGGPKFNMFKVNVNKCQNSTLNNNSCKTNEEIQRFFNMKSLNLYYKTSILQLKNYKTPSIETFYSSVYKLEALLNRLVVITLQKAEIITNEPVVGSNYQQIERFLFEKDKSEIQLSITPQDPVISVLFYSSSNAIIARRSYQSLTEAFAVLGGLFSILVVFGNSISKIDKVVYLTTFLLNNLYSFQQHENQRNSKSYSVLAKKLEEINHHSIKGLSNKSAIIEGKGVSESANKKSMGNISCIVHKNLVEEKETISVGAFKIEPKCLPEEVDIEDPICEKRKFRKHGKFQKTILEKTSKNKDTKSVEEFMKMADKSQQIKFNIFEFCKLAIKNILKIRLSFKEKVYKKAQQVFESEIDIVRILKRLQDIEKLKFLLLNEQQLVLFDILDKPMIWIDENKEKAAIESKMSSNEFKAFTCYQELENKVDCDQIDNKLKLLIGKRFKDIKYFLINVK